MESVHDDSEIDESKTDDDDIDDETTDEWEVSNIEVRFSIKCIATTTPKNMPIISAIISMLISSTN